MTEKRFEWDNINIAITDNQNKKKYWIDVTCIDEIIDLLNELAEENEQLKQIMKFLSNDNSKDILNVLNSQENEIWKLKEENEQLKQQITYLKKVCCNNLPNEMFCTVLKQLKELSE